MTRQQTLNPFGAAYPFGIVLLILFAVIYPQQVDKQNMEFFCSFCY
jgi:hypothetical protein